MNFVDKTDKITEGLLRLCAKNSIYLVGGITFLCGVALLFCAPRFGIERLYASESMSLEIAVVYLWISSVSWLLLGTILCILGLTIILAKFYCRRKKTQ